MIFSRCELAQELIRQGMHKKGSLADWVCLIEGESSRNTKAINHDNEDGSKDWGLYQINDRYWCNTSGMRGGLCNIKCEDLLNDDIREASKCAKIIYGFHEFSAWVAWKTNCANRANLPDLKRECNISDEYL